MNSLKISIIVFAGLFISVAALAQKKVQSFTVSRDIDASVEEVWRVVAEEYADIAKSHPYLSSSSYLEGSDHAGEGCERVCHLSDNGKKYTHEKQIDFDPKNHTFKVVIFHSQGLPLDSDYSTAIYRVQSLENNKSRLSFQMNYRTKPAFMGAMAKGKFKKTISDYLMGVDYHVTTGKNVEKEDLKEIKQHFKSISAS